MTLRVEKPAFNLREKLSELDHPIGVHGAQLMRSESLRESHKLLGINRRNILMNGNFAVNQRAFYGGSDHTFSSGQNGWGMDRWYFHEGTNGAFKISTPTSFPTPPEGGAQYLQVEVTSADTSLGASQYCNISTNVEGYYFNRTGWGTPKALPLTLSFWHRHSLAGTYGGSFRNGNSNYNYVWSYTQAMADRWERAVIAIKPEPTQSWYDNDGAVFRLAFSMGNGSSHLSNNLNNWFSGQYYHAPTNQVNFMGTSGNKFRMAAVQLEVGNQATPFEEVPYCEQLAACRRYYYVIGRGYMAPARGSSSSNLLWPVYTPTPMRANPTVITPSGYPHNSSFSIRAFAGEDAISDSNSVPAAEGAYFYEYSPYIHLTQGGYSITDDRSRNIMIQSGQLGLSAEI